MKLLSFIAASVVLFFQGPGVSVQQPPNGSIEGTVTRLGSTQPVPDARISLMRSGAPAGGRGAPPRAPIRPVTTDAQGKFAVTGLDEGAYNIQVQANGYTAHLYGRRTRNGPGTPLVLSRGQVIKDLSIVLTPAANIAGRVRDTAEQPLVNVPVRLMRYSYDQRGQQTYETVGASKTDDHGEYRMYWVTPGEYYLLAGNPSTGRSSDPFGGADEVFGASGNDVPTVAAYAFYPGVTEMRDARKVELQPAADLRAIDVVMNTKPKSFAVRGKLIDSRTGQPPMEASIFAVNRASGLGFDNPDIRNEGRISAQNYKATGTFEIRNLLPGTYSLVAMAQEPATPRQSGLASSAFGEITVIIGTSDVNDIVLPVVPAPSIVGRWRVDGAAPPQLGTIQKAVHLVPVPQSGGSEGTLASLLSPPIGLLSDGNFRVTNVAPGEYAFLFAGVPIAANTLGYISEARLEGIDVLNSPLRISGSGSKDLDLVFRGGGGQVSGIVTDARSQPVPAARIVLIPERARFRPDLYRTASTDQGGRYALSALAPGEYKIYAWESIEDNAWFDQEGMKPYEPRGRIIRIAGDSNEAIDLQLISGSQIR